MKGFLIFLLVSAFGELKCFIARIIQKIFLKEISILFIIRISGILKHLFEKYFCEESVQCLNLTNELIT